MDSSASRIGLHGKERYMYIVGLLILKSIVSVVCLPETFARYIRKTPKIIMLFKFDNISLSHLIVSSH